MLMTNILTMQIRIRARLQASAHDPDFHAPFGAARLDLKEQP
jgi:hypothetical protein